MGWGNNKAEPTSLLYSKVAAHIRSTRAKKEYQGCSMYHRPQRIVARFDPADTSEQPRIQLWKSYSVESLFGGRHHAPVESRVGTVAYTTYKKLPQLNYDTIQDGPGAILTPDSWVTLADGMEDYRRVQWAEAEDMLSTYTEHDTHFTASWAGGAPRLATQFLTAFNGKTGEVRVTDTVTLDQVASCMPQWRDVDAGFRKQFVAFEKLVALRSVMTGSHIRTRIFKDGDPSVPVDFSDRVWVARHPEWRSQPIELPTGRVAHQLMLDVVKAIASGQVVASQWHGFIDQGWPQHDTLLGDMLSALRSEPFRIPLLIAVETMLGRRPSL